MLRRIRAVDEEVVCWLVTDDPTPRAIRDAFALRVNRMLRYPVEAGALSGALAKALAGPGWPVGSEVGGVLPPRYERSNVGSWGN
jgi:hypothetical protein